MEVCHKTSLPGAENAGKNSDFTVKPWPNGLASRRKFAKPELAHGLAMGRQTDLQVHLHVAKNRMHVQLTCDQLVSTCVGWPNGEKLAYEFELDLSQRSAWPNENNVSRKLASTCESVWPAAFNLRLCVSHVHRIYQALFKIHQPVSTVDNGCIYNQEPHHFSCLNFLMRNSCVLFFF